MRVLLACVCGLLAGLLLGFLAFTGDAPQDEASRPALSEPSVSDPSESEDSLPRGELIASPDAGKSPPSIESCIEEIKDLMPQPERLPPGDKESHGVVVDDRGAPLADIEVIAEEWYGLRRMNWIIYDEILESDFSEVESVKAVLAARMKRAANRRTTRTDALGRFAFTELPTDKYTISPIHPDWTFREQSDLPPMPYNGRGDFGHIVLLGDEERSSRFIGTPLMHLKLDLWLPDGSAPPTVEIRADRNRDYATMREEFDWSPEQPTISLAIHYNRSLNVSYQDHAGNTYSSQIDVTSNKAGARQSVSATLELQTELEVVVSGSWNLRPIHGRQKSVFVNLEDASADPNAPRTIFNGDRSERGWNSKKFPNLVPGKTYRVWLSIDNVTDVYSEVQAITLTPGLNTTEIDLRIPAGDDYTLIYLQDRIGNPYKGVRSIDQWAFRVVNEQRKFHETRIREAYLLDDGGVMLMHPQIDTNASLHDFIWRVVLKSEGFPDNPLTLEYPWPKRVDHTMKGGHSGKVQVTTIGPAITYDDLFIEFTGHDPQVPEAVATGWKVHSDGIAHFDSLAAGRYLLKLRASMGTGIDATSVTIATQIVEVSSSATSFVQVAEQRSDITVSAASYRENLFFLTRKDDPDFTFTVSADERGELHLKGLPPGTYTLTTDQGKAMSFSMPQEGVLTFLPGSGR